MTCHNQHRNEEDMKLNQLIFAVRKSMYMYMYITDYQIQFMDNNNNRLAGVKDYLTCHNLQSHEQDMKAADIG